jgi:hypothetical protein
MKKQTILLVLVIVVGGCRKEKLCPNDVISVHLSVSGFADEQLKRQGDETLVFVDSAGFTMSFLNSDLRKYESRLIVLDTLCRNEDEMYADQVEAIEVQSFRLAYECLQRPEFNLIFNLSLAIVDSMIYEMLSASLIQFGPELLTHEMAIYYFIKRYDIRSETHAELPGALVDVLPDSEGRFVGDTVLNGQLYENVFCGRNFPGCYNSHGLLYYREIDGHEWWLDRIE